MSCERAIDLMIDSLVEPLDEEHLEELNQHVAACEACAAELADYRQFWERLETVAIPEPAPGGLERLQREIRREHGSDVLSAKPATTPSIAVTGRLVQRLAAAAVFMGFGAILAMGLQNYLGGDGSAETQTDDRARFLLIMTETQEGPEFAAQARSELQAWFNDLIDRGIMESGIGLTDGPPVGAPPDGTLLNGPVSGFIVIRAADNQEARRIAVASPVIDYGGFIEIRAISGGGSDQ